MVCDNYKCAFCENRDQPPLIVKVNHQTIEFNFLAKFSGYMVFEEMNEFKY